MSPNRSRRATHNTALTNKLGGPRPKPAVVATSRRLYLFVVMKLCSRRTLHHNVTAHPIEEWRAQQFQEALPGGHVYRFVIHDRDGIFSKELDKQVSAMGVRVLGTPVHAPKANSACERFGGTLRLACLDLLIPINERRLGLALKAWVAHFNSARRPMSLGPEVPSGLRAPQPDNDHRYRIPAGNEVRRTAGRTHHEYWPEKVAA